MTSDVVAMHYTVKSGEGITYENPSPADRANTPPVMSVLILLSVGGSLTK
jgi:hypothetical protein